MEREKCFGMVIVRREGKGLRYLLLHKGGGYWGFPKGRPQPGEDQLTTAKRELAEETGITDVKMIDGFCHGYNYDFDTVIEGGIKKTIYKYLRPATQNTEINPGLKCRTSFSLTMILTFLILSVSISKTSPPML